MSMSSPLWELVKDVPAIKAIFGSSPRIYPHGSAPQNVQKPYAVWQTVTGGAEGNLSHHPDADNFGTQIDTYATTAASAAQGAEVIRYVLERQWAVFGYRDGKDPDTTLMFNGFTVDLLTPRT